MSKYRFDQIAINSKAKKKPTEEDKYHYIGLEHIDSQNLIVSRWGSEVAPKGEKLLMKKGDVLFGKRRAYQKKVAIAPFDGIFSAHGMVLRPNEEVVDKDFFPMFISSDYFLDAAIAISVGSLSPTINWKDLAKLEFDLPPMDEQKKLAEVLWSINDTLQAYQNLLTQTDALVQAQFVEMFENDISFPERKIVDVCNNADDIKCGPFGTQLKQSEYRTSGVAVWGIPEINSDFQKIPNVFITEEKAEKLLAFSLVPGDIAMSRKGNVGQCAIFPDTFKPGIIASDVLRIRVNSNYMLPKFMQYQLHHSERVKRQIELVSNGVVMAGINVTKLKNILVYIPPMDLQRKFVKLANEAEKGQSALQNTIISLQATKRCILETALGNRGKE